MSVEIENWASAGMSKPVEQTEPQGEQIIHKFVACPRCKAQVILFARTIQTFCYQCGEPVTHLDKACMYYEPRAGQV